MSTASSSGTISPAIGQKPRSRCPQSRKASAKTAAYAPATAVSGSGSRAISTWEVEESVTQSAANRAARAALSRGRVGAMVSMATECATRTRMCDLKVV